MSPVKPFGGVMDSAESCDWVSVQEPSALLSPADSTLPCGRPLSTTLRRSEPSVSLRLAEMLRPIGVFGWSVMLAAETFGASATGEMCSASDPWVLDVTPLAVSREVACTSRVTSPLQFEGGTNLTLFI